MQRQDICKSAQWRVTYDCGDGVFDSATLTSNPSDISRNFSLLTTILSMYYCLSFISSHYSLPLLYHSFSVCRNVLRHSCIPGFKGICWSKINLDFLSELWILWHSWILCNCSHFYCCCCCDFMPLLTLNKKVKWPKYTDVCVEEDDKATVLSCHKHKIKPTLTSKKEESTQLVPRKHSSLLFQLFSPL